MDPADRAALSERDICTQFITPAIAAAGWHTHSQMREEVVLTAGRVVVRGNRAARDKTTIRRADYVLYYKSGMPLAVVEAKDAKHSLRDGIQQALDYAAMLDVPFAFSSNGSGFVFHDKTLTDGVLEREIGLDEFPAPDELWRRYLAWKGITSDAQPVFEQDYVSPIPDDLRWRHWAADAEGLTGDALLDLVNNRLFTALKGLNADIARDPRAAVVQAVFEDAFNYMKSGQLLRQVINKINEIDFNNQQERHLFNDLYEKILKDLQSAGNAGEFYTPRAVTQFMVDQTNPRLGEAILDPACGTGGFLACALEHLRGQIKTVDDHQIWQQAIHGVEKKQLPHLLCVTNMLLHGIEVPSQILHDNTLAHPHAARPPHRRPRRAGAPRQRAGR